MNWFAHIIGGLLFVTLLLAVTGQFYIKFEQVLFLGLAYSLAVVSSLLPDIDNRNSIMFRVVNILLFIILYGSSFMTFGLGWGNWTLAIVVPLMVFILWFVFLSRLLIPRHRGIVHSILTMLIWSSVVGVGTGNFILVVVALTGFWSHLVLDGIPFKVI